MKKELDEDVVEIINMLNNNGIKTFASCDGVKAHHIGYDFDNQPMNAYVVMEKNKKSLRIVVFAYKEGFGVSIEKDFVKFDYHNREGENNKKVLEIIKMALKSEKNYENEARYILKLSEFCNYAYEKNINLIIQLNYDYIYHIKESKKNRIQIKFRLESEKENFNEYIKKYYLAISQTKKMTYILFENENVFEKLKDRMSEYIINN